jgi:hypothetical protein
MKKVDDNDRKNTITTNGCLRRWMAATKTERR